jgi:uncharacterized protein YndB with AHSA1/START domain
MESSTADREIYASRLFDAPRERVFQLWTDPQHVIKWWGPRGFTTTIHAMDVRPGGEWRFILHGPDGTDYKNRIVYIEVVPPERLVYKHAGEEEDEPVKFLVTVTFAAEASRTRLTTRMVFDTPEDRTLVAEKYGAVEGLNQTLSRLEELLAKES